MTCPTPEKKVFRSRAHANRHNRRRQPPAGFKKERLYPYQCDCGAWHLTHQTPTTATAWRTYLTKH